MNKRLNLITGAILAFSPTAAWAHPGHEGDGGLLAGLAHPLTGMDHLAAMLLVGLWAGLLVPRGKAALLPPAAFLVAMLAGFLSGGVLAEPIIVASLIVLGVAAAFKVRAPLALAAAASALFGFAHGMAHGFETPQGAFPALFAIGFLVSTGSLHGLGLWLARVLPAPMLRLIGAGAAGLGLVMAAS